MTPIDILILLSAFFIASAFWPSFDAPYLFTLKEVCEKMLRLAKIKKNDVVYELGAGDGRMLILASKKFEAQAVGIEKVPFMFFLIWLKLKFLNLSPRPKIIFSNYKKVDLSPATIVTMYLSQKANNDLVKKLKKELKPGTRIVSRYFSLPGLRLASWDEKDNLLLYLI